MAKRQVTKRDQPSANDRAALEAGSLDTLGQRGANATGNIDHGPDGGSQGFDMYGISGLTRYGAISRVYEEFLRELQGPQGMQSYKEMRDNCPIVGAIMFAALHLCRKVSFTFKPANNSNKAKEVADFVGGAVFDDLESAWPDTLSEILTMLPFGWSMLEVEMKRRLGMGEPVLAPPLFGEVSSSGQGVPTPVFVPSRFDDGKVGFRSWSLRAQETLFMWEFDERSNPIVMQQMAPPDYRIRRVPLVKSLLFRTQVSKNNPEGRSVLRNAWTSYYFKKNLQVFEGIGIERDLAGYPMIQIMEPDPSKGKMVPDVWNTKDPEMVAMLAAMKKIVRSVRRDEQEGIVMPWWAEFKLLSTGSRRSFDTNGIIGRYDQRIAMSMMADFIMLGHEAVGSKALAATKISLFTAALSSFLDTVCAIIDRRATPMLLQFNGIPLELAPTMQHGDVESINIQELGEFIAKVAQTGFNPLAAFEARKTVMGAAHLPTTGMSEEDLPNIPVGGGGTFGDNPDASNGPNNPKDKDDVPGGQDDGVGDESQGSGKAPVAPEESTIGSPDRLTAR